MADLIDRSIRSQVLRLAAAHNLGQQRRRRMGIRTECDIPSCRNSGFDICYCEDCFSDLENQLAVANDKILELEKELEILRKESEGK